MKRIAALILCLLATLAEVEAAKPNVLFIVIDDMNDWISLLNPQSPIKTPNLERLAKRGPKRNRNRPIGRRLLLGLTSCYEIYFFRLGRGCVEGGSSTGNL